MQSSRDVEACLARDAFLEKIRLALSDQVVNKITFVEQDEYSNTGGLSIPWDNIKYYLSIELDGECRLRRYTSILIYSDICCFHIRVVDGRTMFSGMPTSGGPTDRSLKALPVDFSA